MEDGKKVESLIRELDKQREAYMATFSKVNELLTKNLAATAPGSTVRSETPPVAPKSGSRSHQRSISKFTSDPDGYLRNTTHDPSLEASSASRATGDDSDDEHDEALYVQTVLSPEIHDLENFRRHLRSYTWSEYGRKILEGVVGNNARIWHRDVIPNHKGPHDDRSHYSHCQVFDVAPDGSPLAVDHSAVESESGRAMAVWHAIKDVNSPGKQRQAVGRIVIVREPSPILFGAIHYTMHRTFDIDELFGHLVKSSSSSANMHRAFYEDERKRRSFVFNFEYFTLLGKDCQPMKWQLAACQEDRKPGHVAITRCSSVVALCLNGPPVKKVKNPARQATTEHGYIYDPFASWQVLNVQCYPDWRASLDIHDSTKHYVNGPEAFMHQLLGEYRDAQQRFECINKAISDRVRPPLEFIFDGGMRDRLLFEDKEYTMSRRYFWAHQTLGIVNESIRSLIDAYEDTFTEDVWEGRHKTLWPILDEESPRNVYYKKKMASLKKRFDVEMINLRKLIIENNDRRDEILGLRETLFSGTSIEESRKSVDATETTVQQGHNIKLLTLVSIFFLPLTFVTSVFGMTNMPTAKHYWMFGIVTATVCVPFFVLIGSLNTHRGLNFWRRKSRVAIAKMGSLSKWVASGGREPRQPQLISVQSFESSAHSNIRRPAHVMSSLSQQPDGVAMRLRRWSTSQKAAKSSENEEMREEKHGKPSIDASLGDGSPAPHIIEMLRTEQRRGLRYSPEV